MTNFDSKKLRSTLGAFTTGVTVMTTVDADGKRHGVTANSFSSVSLDPPLILWSQALTSRSYPAFRDGEFFAVNIMADDQAHISNQFASKLDDKFVGIATSEGLGGIPIIDESAAYLECSKVAAYPGGDHVIYIGKVESLHRSVKRPLAFGEGKYVITFAHDLGGRAGDVELTGDLRQVKAVSLASAMLPEIAQQVGNRTVGLAVWGNRGPTIIRWEASSSPVSSYLQAGAVVSFTRSATGVVFAAFCDRELTQAGVEAEFEGSGNMRSEIQAAFSGRLEEARALGLSRDIGTSPSSRHLVLTNAFSAPVFDATGTLVAALTVIDKAERLGTEVDGECPKALGEAARRLSDKLGCESYLAALAQGRALTD
jgi:flavin reductase (DIM6/NTAB) family NADH-FMN oxidoreductase RutF/DNA-binding IclR family transcriptional regulator